MVRDLRDIAQDAGMGGGGGDADKNASDEGSTPIVNLGQASLADVELAVGVDSVAGSVLANQRPTSSGKDRLRMIEKDVAEGGPGASFVHTTIFPGDDFVFVGECNVLVLAEDRNRAEQHLSALQVGSICK